jgi:hypothetical protein
VVCGSMSKKAQNWSLEVIIALSVFLVIFVLVSVFMFYVPTDRSSDLRSSTNNVVSTLENNLLIENGAVKTDGLTTLSNYSCSDLQDLFAISGEVCISFEDLDGNVIYVDNKTGIGCPGINFSNGKVCGER